MEGVEDSQTLYAGHNTARLPSGAFTAAQACRLSGVPYRSLDYWARSGFLLPSAHEATGRGTWRGYTFRDIVSLTVAKRLRDAGLSLQGIRKVMDLLRREQHLEAPLAETYLLTDGRDVFQVKRGRDEVWSLLRAPGQRGFPWIVLDLTEAAREVRQAAEVAGLRAEAGAM